MTTAKKLQLATLCFRWCLGVTFLSAVADRLGLWGPNGSKYASWGDWSHFLIYSSSLNWFLPAALQNPVAILASSLEFAFGAALIAGLWVRYAAWGSAALLTMFALAMASAGGIKSPLNYSVFVDVAGAILLAVITSAMAEMNLGRENLSRPVTRGA